jgi:predicted aspartyl protease
LPPSLVKALGLRWRSVDRATLADGSEFIFDVYEGKVVWDGQVRHILIDEADAEPLVGMRLLRDSELNLQVRSGGKVTIKRMATR